MKKIFSHYPFGVISAFFMGGIFIQRFVEFPFLLLTGLFIPVIVMAWLWRKKFPIVGFLGIIFLLMGAINFTIWTKNNLHHPLLNNIIELPVKLSCIVLEPPLHEKKTLIVKIHTITLTSKEINLDRKFVLRVPYFLPNLLPGDTLRISPARLDYLEERRNPGQFDYKSYLQGKGVVGQISLFTESCLEILRSSYSWNFRRIFYRIRLYLDQRLKNALNPESAAFISAIMLGKKEQVSQSVKEDFQNSGVAHVLAISGLHVGFIVYFIHLLLSFLPVSFRSKNIMLMILLIFYMILTGLNPPVVRATIMVIIYLLGMNFERKPNVYNSLFAAIFVILCFEPQQLFGLSFQFSVTAVFSILIFYQLLKPVESKISGLLPDRKLLKSAGIHLIQLFLVSLAAQIGTLPLVAITFKQIPIISIVLNLMVIPLVALILPIGFMVLIFSLFSKTISVVLGDFLSGLVEILFRIVHIAAELPISYVKISQVHVIDFLLYFTVIIIVFSFSQAQFRNVRKHLYIALLLMISWKMIPDRTALQLIMFDVGQGSSTLIISPENKYVIYDLGPADNRFDSGVDVILPALQSLNKLRVEKLIISHPHADHLAGLFSLTPEIDVDSVYLPDLRVSYDWQDRAIEFLDHEGIPYRLLKCGDILNIDKWTKMYVLSPFMKNLYPSHFTGGNINNLSVVCLLKSASNTVLFTGDTEKGNEKKLLSWQGILQSQILVIGHHGSGTSSSFEFLKGVSPQWGLISVGRNNRFDHPAPTTLHRLEDLNITYRRTDLVGALWLKSERGNWELLNWR